MKRCSWVQLAFMCLARWLQVFKRKRVTKQQRALHASTRLPYSQQATGIKQNELLLIANHWLLTANQPRSA